ncbi:MAG: alpha/beta hydrolase family protein [Candidatus Zipacnadales bacterium]
MYSTGPVLNIFQPKGLGVINEHKTVGVATQSQKGRPMASPNRYLSPYESAVAWIANETSALSFDGSTKQDWRRWRKAFERRLRELLGPFPALVPLEPEVVETVDCGDHRREKVFFNSEKYATVAAYVLVPKDLRSGERRPGILAAHGHGRGKADICGVCDTDNERAHITSLNYDYAHQFARRGYVVVAPDWRGFGERRSPDEWVRPNRDPCNVNYMAMGYLGYHLLALQIWDGMRTVDYLQSRPEVDPDRLGVGGLSFGGTMTTYLAALDPRLKVACISGYLSTIKGDAITMRGKGNFCGAQYMPGLLTLGDIPDVAGLIAPKPLCVEMGEQDQCFVIDDAKAAYAHLERIYAAAGAADHLIADIHPGGHVWSGAKSFAWFEHWLS